MPGSYLKRVVIKSPRVSYSLLQTIYYSPSRYTMHDHLHSETADCTMKSFALSSMAAKTKLSQKILAREFQVSTK